MATKKAQRLHWARHHRILAGSLIVVIIVAAGLAIAQDKETLRVRTSLAIDDPRARPAPERARDWLWSYFGEVF